jgi:hypothetical protein
MVVSPYPNAPIAGIGQYSPRPSYTNNGTYTQIFRQSADSFQLPDPQAPQGEAQINDYATGMYNCGANELQMSRFGGHTFAPGYNAHALMQSTNMWSENRRLLPFLNNDNIYPTPDNPTTFWNRHWSQISPHRRRASLTPRSLPSSLDDEERRQQVSDVINQAMENDSNLQEVVPDEVESQSSQMRQSTLRRTSVVQPSDDSNSSMAGSIGSPQRLVVNPMTDNGQTSPERLTMDQILGDDSSTDKTPENQIPTNDSELGDNLNIGENENSK